MRFFRILLIILPILFTAQACNFLFGDIYGDKPSGARGVYVSTDNGDSWGEANGLQGSQNLRQARILRLVIEPGKPDNLLAASVNTGLFASDSKAKEWFALLPNFAAYDIFFNPSNPEEIFVAGAKGNLATILKSPDRGGAWLEIYNQPLGEAAVSAMIFDPKNPSLFYAGLTSGIVLKSIDRGQTWNAVADLGDRIVSLSIASDQSIYALTRNQGLKKSQDAGKSWAGIKAPEQAKQFFDFFVDSTNSQVWYLGTNSGLYKTTSGGSTWIRLALPADPEFSSVSAVTASATNPRLVFAAIRATIYRSSDGGVSWHPVGLATRQTVADIVIDPSEPNRIYASLK